MRISQAVVGVIAALALAACVMPGAKAPAKPAVNPITGEAIATTSLDAPKAEAPKAAAPTGKVIGKDPAPKAASPLMEPPQSGFVDASADAIAATEAAKAPKGQPAKPAATKAEAQNDPAKDSKTEAAPAEPEPPHIPGSPEEAKCLKSGGTWATAGKGSAKACVKTTRDAGKACTRQSQCEGYCLARSGTCAPITPMFGCNDILQDDGRQVTLCLD